jgi:hypothetical protein
VVFLVCQIVLFAAGYAVGRLQTDDPVPAAQAAPVGDDMVSRDLMDAAVKKAADAEVRASQAEARVAELSQPREVEPAKPDESLLNQLSELREQSAKLNQELAGSAQKTAELEAEIEGRDKKIEELQAEIESLSTTGTLLVGWGKWAGMREVLQTDFEAAGIAANRMKEPLQKFLAELEAGKQMHEIDQELMQEISESNNRLIEVATRLDRHIPTNAISANGAFTHPVIQFNMLAQSLAAAGVPLTEMQKSQLRVVAESYDQTWEANQQRYDETTYRLQKIGDELEAKIRVREQVESILTAMQINAAMTSESGDFVGFDLYSPSLMMMGMVQPTVGINPGLLREQVTEAVVRVVGSGAANDSAISVAVVGFLGQTGQLHGQAVDTLHAYAKYSPNEALTALKAQLRMYQTIESSIRPTAQQLSRMRQSTTVILPRTMKSE